MKLIRVVCIGVSPLLMNRVSEEVLLSLDDKSNKAAKSAPKRGTPRERCEEKVHKDGHGRPCIGSDAMLASLRNYGRFVRLDGKRQVSTATSTVLPSFLSLQDLHLPLFDPDNLLNPVVWEVDMRRGTNPNGGEMVCIVRPRFDRWGFGMRLAFDDRQVSEGIIRQLVDGAGSAIGLYDGRPSRGGTNGRFVVTSWEVHSNSVEGKNVHALNWDDVQKAVG